MSASRVSAPSVMRSVLASDGIAVRATPSRRGDARWQAGDLEYWAWVDREYDGTIGCYTNIGDAKYAEAMDGMGRMSVRVRSTAAHRDWPTGKTIAQSDLDWIVGQFKAQFEFIADRADLCRTLAEKGDVYRGAVYAWQPESSYPARLVEALIIARDLGSDELQETVTERLRSVPLIMNSAKDWAKDYSKALGFPVAL